MSPFLAIPVLVILTGLAGRWWGWARRRDARSIESHRSALGIIEHVSGTDEDGEVQPRPGVSVKPASAHVKVVSSSVPTSPRIKPEPPVTRPPRSLLAASREVPPVRGPAAEATASGQVPAWQVTSRQPTPHRGSSRTPPPVASRPARPESPPESPAEPSTPPMGTTSPPPLVFVDEPDDAREPAATPAPASGARALAAARAGVAFRPGAHRHRQRGGGNARAALAAAVAVAVIAGGAYAAVHYLSTGGSHTTAAAGRPASSSGHSPTSHPTSTDPTTPTSTTVPAPQVTPTGSGSYYADYTVAATSLDVSLVVTDSCWVEVRDGSSSGSITYEGTLKPGVSQNFQATGGLWIRLGDPSGVSMDIDGSPVQLPSDSSPFDVAVSGSTGA